MEAVAGVLQIAPGGLKRTRDVAGGRCAGASRVAMLKVLRAVLPLSSHAYRYMPQTVLVIEDDAMIREVLAEILQSAGYDAVGAAGGREGLDRIAAEPPDLVLCDFHMPGVTGFDVLKALRTHPETRAVPLVVITADSSADVRARARHLGASGMLLKPFDAEQLLATVRNLLRPPAYA